MKKVSPLIVVFLMAGSLLRCAPSDMPKTTRVNIEIGKPNQPVGTAASASSTVTGASKKAYSGARKSTLSQNYTGYYDRDSTR